MSAAAIIIIAIAATSLLLMRFRKQRLADEYMELSILSSLRPVSA